MQCYTMVVAFDPPQDRIAVPAPAAYEVGSVGPLLGIQEEAQGMDKGGEQGH